ncbi:hypothetical protein M422DRAFT_155180 [Sphaerobolus stellatus SS14]|nr:hypothetical protein M422DRAFT_155180 [Sphaerobolus stellatus SS14]
MTSPPRSVSPIEYPEQDKQGNVAGRVARFATAVILLCAVIDVVLLVYFATRLSFQPSFDIRDLESPSTYIGFNKLYSNSSSLTKHKPLYNQARYHIQVSAEEPNRNFPMWVERAISIEGFVPTVVNHLIVTPKISTIVQFRTRDYGMENCSLHLEIPAQNSTETSVFISSAKGALATLEIWSLAGERRLNPADTTWATKPNRKSKLGTVELTYGTKAVISQFHCPSGSYHTFELACVSEQCKVDSQHFGFDDDGQYHYSHGTGRID